MTTEHDQVLAFEKRVVHLCRHIQNFYIAALWRYRQDGDIHMHPATYLAEVSRLEKQIRDWNPFLQSEEPREYSRLQRLVKRIFKV